MQPLPSTVEHMEAFEQFVAVALREEGFVVSEAVKFPVARQVRKDRIEVQTHGYEVDLVGARADRLVLATVKSFFGSRGVQESDVTGTGGNAGLYRLLNDPVIRNGVVKCAANLYRYTEEQVFLRLYVGKFLRHKDGTDDREAITRWCETTKAGGGVIEVFGVDDVVAKARLVAVRKSYINDPVIVAMKVLAAAGILDLRETPLS